LKIGLECSDEKIRAGRRKGQGPFEPISHCSHLDRRIASKMDTQRVDQGNCEETGGYTHLHYLNNADGRQPTGRLKHFREFKDGHFYEPAFNRRTKEILIQVFGKDPAPMIAAAGKLKGKVLETGDAAVELPYFPCLPITCILWKGDDEFPPEATVLFDETADLFFSAEDMAVAGQMAVLELLKAARG
jgi:hypothetical protein